MTEYLIGDASEPEGEGLKLIIHVCNNIGKWGSGFTQSLDNKWSKPRKQYLLEHSFFGHLTMGGVQVISVEEDIMIVNMICQQGVNYKGRTDKPIRYDDMEECLYKVGKASNTLNASVHMPRIGCGLAGGEWKDIVKLVEKNIKVPKYVYDRF